MSDEVSVTPAKTHVTSDAWSKIGDFALLYITKHAEFTYDIHTDLI